MLQNKDVTKINRLVRQMSQEQMRDLNHSIVDLLRSQRKLENLQALQSLNVGDKVRTVSNLRPSHFADILCKISSMRQTKCTVTILEGPYKDRPLRVSAGALVAAKKTKALK